MGQKLHVVDWLARQFLPPTPRPPDGARRARNDLRPFLAGGKIGRMSGSFDQALGQNWSFRFLGLKSKTLRNVVFGENEVKMTQKQHIGNFQI